MRKQVWEAIIAVAVEESVRVFLPPLLPYVWFIILIGLTIELLRLPRSKRIITYIWNWLKGKHWVLAYGIVSVVVVSVLAGYAVGVHKAFGVLKRREHEANTELAKELVKDMPQPEPKTRTIIPLPPEGVDVKDSVAGTVKPAPKSQRLPSRVKLIFKDSPLLNDARKHKITDLINNTYDYLTNVGYAVSVYTPPIGVADDNALHMSGVFPGAITQSQIYFPRNSIDDDNEVRKLYLVYVFKRLLGTFGPGAGLHTDPRDHIAATIFAIYYASSIAGKDIDHSRWNERKWTRALWEIRRTEGRESTDQYLYYAFQSWRDIQSTPDEDFDKWFDVRLMSGVWVKANGGKRIEEIQTIINKNLTQQP